MEHISLELPIKVIFSLQQCSFYCNNIPFIANTV